MQTLQELTVLYRCYWLFFIFRGDPAFRPNRRSDRCSDGWCCLSGVPGKQICQQFVYTFILVSTHNRLTSVVSLHLLHLPLWKRADKSQAEETVVLADFWVFTSRHLLQLLGFVSHRVTLVGFLRHWALDCCSTGNHIILEASLLCLRQRWGVLPDSVFFSLFLILDHVAPNCQTVLLWATNDKLWIYLCSPLSHSPSAMQTSLFQWRLMELFIR